MSFPKPAIQISVPHRYFFSQVFGSLPGTWSCLRTWKMDNTWWRNDHLDAWYSCSRDQFHRCLFQIRTDMPGIQTNCPLFGICWLLFKIGTTYSNYRCLDTLKLMSLGGPMNGSISSWRLLWAGLWMAPSLVDVCWAGLWMAPSLTDATRQLLAHL